MINNYFFIDGSALVAQIRELQKRNGKFKGHKLNPLKLINHFMRLGDLHSGEYKRAVFYFAKDDSQIKDYLLLPDFRKPGLIRDVHFKYCGKKLRSSRAYEKFLETVPKKYLDKCSKSEKGVDIELCCDALQLSATSKLERLFLLTNDSDFIPLCKRLKDFGTNISLLRLSRANRVNISLVEECDSYDVVLDVSLEDIFDIVCLSKKSKK